MLDEEFFTVIDPVKQVTLAQALCTVNWMKRCIAFIAYCLSGTVTKSL